MSLFLLSSGNELYLNTVSPLPFAMEHRPTPPRFLLPSVYIHH